MEGWVSPSLEIRFSKNNGELEIYYPDGRRFLTTIEFNTRAVSAEEERDLLAQERDRLLEQLRALGIDPEAH
jgi:hypothetical protein